MIKYYNIHNQIKMRVVNPSNIFNRLSIFESETLKNIDLDIIIGPFNVDLSEFEKSGNAYRNYNSFYIEYRHKLSFWRILIEGFSDCRTTILFDGDPYFSNELLLMLILEPLFVYKMSKKGGLVLHASSLSVNGSGCIFTGDTGIGKTSILLKLLNRANTEYYADDQTFIIDNKIHSYAVPIGFRKHLASRNNVVVSKSDNLMMNIHSLINHLLGFYPNLTQRIKPENITYSNGRKVVSGSVIPLKKVFILTKTDNSPGIQQISGKEAYPMILKANNKNEDKLKVLYKFVNLFSTQMEKTFWTDFEHNLGKLVNNPDIEFYLVYLNKKYDYKHTIDEINRITEGPN